MPVEALEKEETFKLGLNPAVIWMIATHWSVLSVNTTWRHLGAANNANRVPFGGFTWSCRAEHYNGPDEKWKGRQMVRLIQVDSSSVQVGDYWIEPESLDDIEVEVRGVKS